MKRTPGWHRWARLARWMTMLVLALAIVTGLMVTVGLSGLSQRLLAAGAAGIALLAVGILRRSRA